MASASGSLVNPGDVVSVVPASSDLGATVALTGTFAGQHIVFQQSTNGTTWTTAIAFDNNGKLLNGAAQVDGLGLTVNFGVDFLGANLSAGGFRVLLQGAGTGTVSVALNTQAYTPEASDVNNNNGSVKGVLLNQASAQKTVSGASVSFNAGTYDTLIVGVNVSASGGSPSYTFGVDTLGPDGVWYNVWTSAAVTNNVSTVTTIGTGQVTNSQFGNILRLNWTKTAGSVTFTGIVMGKKMGLRADM